MSYRKSAIFVGLGLLLGSPAYAQSVDSFYHGNTINIYIGTGESAGAVGAYPRILSQFISKYIPGNPTLVVRNMPGAGGIKAANYVYGLAPQDGTVWGFITRGFLLAPLLKYQGVEFDPTKFKWIGSPARTVSIGAIWSENTNVRTIQEAMQNEVVVGATSPGQDTGVFPKALNQLTGTKFKIVTGYKSVGDVDLAMEKGEVHGKVGFTWTSLNSGRSTNWVRDKKITVLVQLGVEKDPSIPAEVPLALDLAKTAADRQLLELLCAPSATGYPSFMGPGVPDERVKSIREAYLQTMTDPGFVDALKKQSLDIDPIRGEDIANIVSRLYAQPVSVVERAREMLPPS